MHIDFGALARFLYLADDSAGELGLINAIAGDMVASERALDDRC